MLCESDSNQIPIRPEMNPMGYDKSFPSKFNYTSQLDKCRKISEKKVPKSDVSIIKPNRNIKIENYNQLRKSSLRKMFRKEFSALDSEGK
ncbi:MAG: hypothetical protein ACTSVZ_13975 [Promethearchaeota archaeon]